ncbi:MAG: HlyD family type I secretion periplasmic adaptor subunit [Ahrensia sp.]|nr:HlyD family type I secretion periplasmic adaptor subunit [Ahrensia sp.]
MSATIKVLSNSSSQLGLSATSAALMEPDMRAAKWLIFLVALAVATAIGWSSQANVVEVAVSEGRVIPASKVQLVQNLEGGIIREILVREGATVKKGALLVRIDPTTAGSSLEERRQHMLSLEAGAALMRGLLDEKAPEFSTEFSTEHPDLVSRTLIEHQALLSEFQAALGGAQEQLRQRTIELQEVESQLGSTQRSLAIASEQLQLLENLARQKAASRNDVLSSRAKNAELEGEVAQLQLSIPRLRAAIGEGENRLKETSSRFRAQNAAKLNEMTVKLRALGGASQADEDRINRSDVRSPVDGIVKILHANTIGQVVKPAESILEIVPANDSLVVQAQVLPKDIAFLFPGQTAIIKVTAYDHSIFGYLQGKVERISADSVIDEKGNAFFPVDIHADQAFLERERQRYPIMPGMVAQVDIVTGEKTVLSFLTKPIHRMAFGAFRER